VKITKMRMDKLPTIYSDWTVIIFSDKVKVTYLDEEFMKTVAIKKSHVLLLSEDRIRKSDIRFCRRQS